jgi:hypothetical protein
MPALGDYDETLGADWEYRSFRVTSSVQSMGKGFIRVKVIEADTP